MSSMLARGHRAVLKIANADDGKLFAGTLESVLARHADASKNLGEVPEAGGEGLQRRRFHGQVL